MIPVPEEVLAAVKEIPGLITRLEALETAARRPPLHGPARAYYDLPQACAARGASYGVIRHEAERQPRGGVADFCRGRRRYWYPATIEAWDPAPPRPKLAEVRAGRPRGERSVV
jgi:hypothetical protein